MFKKKEDVILPKEEVISFMGKGVQFKGVVTYEGTIRVDSEIEGEIITEGTLIVGESGILEAEIRVGTIIIGGRVNGNIQASQKIQLLPRSVVTGRLIAPSIVMEDGAIFNGICEMKRSLDPALQPEPSEKHVLTA